MRGLRGACSAAKRVRSLGRLVDDEVRSGIRARERVEAVVAWGIAPVVDAVVRDAVDQVSAAVGIRLLKDLVPEAAVGGEGVGGESGEHGRYESVECGRQGALV